MRAAGQNLKRLLKQRGWGRRSWPEGAVKALLEPPSADRIPLPPPSLVEMDDQLPKGARVHPRLQATGVAGDFADCDSKRAKARAVPIG